MNISNMLHKLSYTKVGRLVYDNGPTAMVVAGTGILAGAGIHAVVKTPAYVERVEEMRYQCAHDEAKRKVAIETLKTYAPDVAAGVCGAAMIFGGHGIVHGRYVKAAAAWAAETAAYEEYRSRVIDRYGEEADRDIRYGTEEETYTVTETSKKGKEKEVEKTRKIYHADEAILVSPFSRIFSKSTNPNWTGDKLVDRNFLLMKQNYLQFKLEKNRRLFWNEALIEMDYEPTFEGQYMGWSLDKNPNSTVDLGLFKPDPENRRMVWREEGDECYVLDFNIDGQIIDELPKEMRLPFRTSPID